MSSSEDPIGLVTAIVRAAAEQRPRPLRRGSGKRMVAGSSLETCLSAMKAAPETHVASVGNAVRRCSFEQSGFPMKCTFTPRCSSTRKTQNLAHTFTPMKCCPGFISPTRCRANEAISQVAKIVAPKWSLAVCEVRTGYLRRTRIPPQTARGAPGETAFSFGQSSEFAMSEPLGLNELLVRNPAVA